MTDFTKLSPEDLARVTTRDGKRVEIITTKGREPQPVVGYIGDLRGTREWCANGLFYLDARECAVDLIIPPASRVYYLNGYLGQVAGHHKSAEDARDNRGLCWLALYKITDDGVNATIEVIERNKGA